MKQQRSLRAKRPMRGVRHEPEPDPNPDPNKTNLVPTAYVSQVVESELVQKVAWTGILVVVLRHGDGTRGQYAYLDVPRETYEAFIQSKSKGQFFNTQIKGKYPSFPVPIGVGGVMGTVVDR